MTMSILSRSVKCKPVEAGRRALLFAGESKINRVFSDDPGLQRQPVLPFSRLNPLLRNHPALPVIQADLQRQRRLRPQPDGHCRGRVHSELQIAEADGGAVRDIHHRRRNILPRIVHPGYGRQGTVLCLPL